MAGLRHCGEDMENIIGLIGNAEREASAKKAEALKTAAQIQADADKKAQESLKSAETELAAYKENAVRLAGERAEADYVKTLNASRESAVRFADELIAKSDKFVLEIVGRLTK